MPSALRHGSVPVRPAFHCNLNFPFDQFYKPGLRLTFTFNILILQVLIEAGSASSFELSPRFAANRRDLHDRGSREQIQDVESELHEAMSDAFDTEEVGSLLDGKFYISFMFFIFLKNTAN